MSYMFYCLFLGSLCALTYLKQSEDKFPGCFVRFWYEIIPKMINLEFNAKLVGLLIGFS